MSDVQRHAEGTDFVQQQALTSEHYRLFGIIQSRLALTLDQYKIADIVRVCNQLVPSQNIDHFRHFVETLSEKPPTHPLWQEVIRVITVGETYFFRDLNQLDAIRHKVLPQLIQERRKLNKHYLRLWSAGCSTGEEPYTLAMILREMIEDINEWDITILATDLNASSLERARNGHYRPWSFRSETPLEIYQHWFTEVQDGYQIDSSVARMVDFAPLNLAQDDYPSYASDTMEMDLVFCRNVLIYFNHLESTAVIERFHRALHRDGWLALGPAETLPSTNSGFTVCNFENAILFQKRIGQSLLDINIGLDFEKHELDLPESSVSIVHPESSILYHYDDFRENIAPIPAPTLDPWEQALAAANSEQWSKALGWLEDAETQHQLNPEIHYLRGVIELNRAETDKALASLRRAIYCDPGFVLAHYTLGELYQSEGKYRKAASQWRQAQTILGVAQPEIVLPLSHDLTVEMLSRLLQFRLDNLPVKS